LNYVIEGLVFLVTGLQARTVIRGIHGYSTFTVVASAAVVCAVVIATRFLWMFPATYVPRWVSRRLRARDPSPPWQFPFLLSAAGVRGVVSLAAALALPATLLSGAPFPHRDLVLFIAFAVILVTLVGQGLALPGIVRWLGIGALGIAERHAERVEEHAAKRRGVEAASLRLEELTRERRLSEELVHPLRVHQEEELENIEGRQGAREGHASKIAAQRDALALQLLNAERGAINDLYRDGALKDEPRRRLERDLDLREADLLQLRGEE
jgi:NhaP-type Na+/H+ or K+/H+ antiporter